jgi:galactose mutarotase-like enzyme
MESEELRMARLYGSEFTRHELMKHVGDVSQLAGAKAHELTSGKAKGVEAVDVKTGAGLSFTILPSRGMDIAWTEFQGLPLAYMAKPGVVGPQFFTEDANKGFLENFFAGLVTTCGLTYFGASNVDEGVALGLHGRVSNLPAEDVSVYQEWEGDEFVVRVRGKVREASVFGADMVLTREISTHLGAKSLSIHDRVENLGYAAQPLMLLYHCNFGFPLVGAATRLHTSSAKVQARDATAEAGVSDFDRFQAPTRGYAEQCFFLDLQPGAKGDATACLFNPTLGTKGVGAFVRYDKKTLPYFTEWKMMGEQEYVVGLEPGTWTVQGRAEARRRGELQMLQPGESREFRVEIGVVEGEEELKALLG